MIKAWFMFDNHTFADIPLTTPSEVIDRVIALFQEDGCGSVGLHINGGTSDKHWLHGHMLPHGRYGVKPSEIAEWVEKVFEEVSFQSMMSA